MNELEQLRGLPRDEAGPVFEEPWQAQAFALVIALHARGVFSWQDWTRALAAELEKDPHADGTHYYHCWLRALEGLVGRLGLTD